MSYFDLQVNGYAGIDFNSDFLTNRAGPRGLRGHAGGWDYRRPGNGNHGLY